MADDSVKSYGYLMSLDIFDGFYEPEQLTEFIEDTLRSSLMNVDNIECTLMGELTKEEVVNE